MADPPDDRGRNIGMFKTYEYDQKDHGPFRVILQLLENPEGKLKINKLGRLLSKVDEYKANIQNLRMLGANRELVFLSSYQSAKKLQKDTLLMKNNLKAYIPRNFVSVIGVVAGVPIDMSIDEIKENIKSDVPIMGIARLHRYEEGKKEEAQRICITFRTNKLPADVKMFCCINTVRPFISKPVLCYNCLRYNHKTKSCRSRKRCQNCALQHENMETEECPNKTRCLYCKSEHRTTEQDCPERVRQKNIKVIMSKSTLTFMEAKEQNPILTQNRYEALENVDDFPMLPNSFSTITAGNFKPTQGYKPKPQPQKRSVHDVIIANEVEVFKDKKKKKDSEEQNGTALFNKFKVTESEKWTSHMDEQRKRTLEEPAGTFSDDTNSSTSRLQTSLQPTSNRKTLTQRISSQMDTNT